MIMEWVGMKRLKRKVPKRNCETHMYAKAKQLRGVQLEDLDGQAYKIKEETGG